MRSLTQSSVGDGSDGEGRGGSEEGEGQGHQEKETCFPYWCELAPVLPQIGRAHV